MTTFKVGDRIRIIGPADPRVLRDPKARAAMLRRTRKHGSMFAKTGTIVGIPSAHGDSDCSVVVDDHAPEPHYGSYAALFWQLAPLDEEAFMRFIEELESLPALKPEQVVA